jgi:hypothetical protein
MRADDNETFLPIFLATCNTTCCAARGIVMIPEDVLAVVIPLGHTYDTHAVIPVHPAYVHGVTYAIGCCMQFDGGLIKAVFSEFIFMTAFLFFTIGTICSSW